MPPGWGAGEEVEWSKVRTSRRSSTELRMFAPDLHCRCARQILAAICCSISLFLRLYYTLVVLSWISQLKIKSGCAEAAISLRWGTVMALRRGKGDSRTLRRRSPGSQSRDSLTCPGWEVPGSRRFMHEVQGLPEQPFTDLLELPRINCTGLGDHPLAHQTSQLLPKLLRPLPLWCLARLDLCHLEEWSDLLRGSGGPGPSLRRSLGLGS